MFYLLFLKLMWLVDYQFNDNCQFLRKTSSPDDVRYKCSVKVSEPFVIKLEPHRWC